MGPPYTTYWLIKEAALYDFWLISRFVPNIVLSDSPAWIMSATVQPNTALQPMVPSHDLRKSWAYLPLIRAGAA
jgi:hypothetical protein